LFCAANPRLMAGGSAKATIVCGAAFLLCFGITLNGVGFTIGAKSPSAMTSAGVKEGLRRVDTQPSAGAAVASSEAQNPIL